MYNIHTQRVQHLAGPLGIPKPLPSSHIVSLLETAAAYPATTSVAAPVTTAKPTTMASKSTTTPSGAKPASLVETTWTVVALPLAASVTTTSVTTTVAALLAWGPARTARAAEGAHAGGVLGVDHAGRAGLDGALQVDRRELLGGLR